MTELRTDTHDGRMHKINLNQCSTFLADMRNDSVYIFIFSSTKWIALEFHFNFYQNDILIRNSLPQYICYKHYNVNI